MPDPAPPRSGAAPHGVGGPARDPRLRDLERRQERLLAEIDSLNERIEAVLVAVGAAAAA